MSVTVQQQGHSSRSESLQRMLDLEKKMMLQRTQSLTNSSLTSSVHLIPVPQPQPRRFELVPKDGKKAPPPPIRIYDQIPTQPVAVNSTHNHVIESDIAISRRLLVKGHSRTNSAPVGTIEKVTPKQVAFAFPPNVGGNNSKAHDRRKQDREDKQEDTRQERRGREQSVSRDKPRGRRLSKAPPVSRNQITQGRSNTDPASPSKDKRSSSVLGVSITRRDTADTRNEPADRSRRGRSGSLSSAIRSSFEIRRGSHDQTTASGFLGGVKLEKKKQDFTQQVIEDQARNTSRVHPALRKSFLGHGSFTPLKASPTQSEPDKEADAQQRAYPPISIQTCRTMAQAAMSPQTPLRRDSAGSANIYLWSARATKKAVEPSDECAVTDDIDDDETEQRPAGVTLIDMPSVCDSEATTTPTLARRGGLHIKNSPHLTLTSKRSRDSQEEASQDGTEDVKPLNIKKTSSETTSESAETVSRKRQTEETSVIELKDRAPSPSTAASIHPRRESTASVVFNPPAPPRKSSKRSSVVVLARSPPAPVETSKEDQLRSSKEGLGAEKKLQVVTKVTTTKRNATPPSIRYESTLPGVRPTPYPAESPTLTTSSKWTLKDTAKSALGRGESPSSDGNSYPASISPISSTGSLFKGRMSPVIPPSPLKNEATLIVPTQPHIGVQPVPKQMEPPKSIPSYSRPSRLSTTEHLTPKRNSATSHWRPTTSSSDDSSYSEALQSSSASGTPDSSPPQSDSGFPPQSGSGKHQPIVEYSPYSAKSYSPELSSTDRFQLSDSPPSSDSDLDPIEAAARRVLEAFAHANLQSPTNSRQDPDSSEDSYLSSGPDPQQHHPRLRHREKSKGRLRTTQMQQAARLSQSGSSEVKASRSTPNLDVRSSQNHHKRTSTVPTAPTLVPDVPQDQALRPGPQRGDRVGKMFVVCCECKRYHDIPAKLYQTMLNPGGVFTNAETKGFEDRVCMTIKCSWCDHQMSTKCCPGVSGILDIQGRVH